MISQFWTREQTQQESKTVLLPFKMLSIKPKQMVGRGEWGRKGGREGEVEGWKGEKAGGRVGKTLWRGRVLVLTNDDTLIILVGVNVYVPPGTYKHNNVITIANTHLYGDGDGSVMYSTDQENRALQMQGSNCGVRKLKVTGKRTP